ncbi:MAG: hypothetical protein LBD59_09490 [Prevotellaceae bacterium]|jgi:hypothetical protein|nr:hypothetical protein [Prevotellaceae bacterium]
MNKLYVIGIGGTGSRVLKSLTMLLAAGVKINASEIVPIIIDPDLAAGDLERAVSHIRNYCKVYDALDHNTASSNTFFGTKINTSLIPSLRIPVKNTADVAFKDFIGLALMKDDKANYNANHALASILFSERNLDSTMEVGFKGNPNIGSVVLNQFSSSKEFKDLAEAVKKDDRIFIISSIFGGTGAAGFPLLAKEIRKEKSKDENAALQNVPIGAVTVLPYFDVKADENSEIDSTPFFSKTKAALSYYKKNLNEVNVMYYIGDKPSNLYANSEGGAEQRNDAHFVELAAALAIIDFAQYGDADFPVHEGKLQHSSIYKEFGIKNEAKQITFGDLDETTNLIVKKPLTQFTLFCKYLNEQINDSLKQPWALKHKFDENFMTSAFYRSNLKAVKDAYIEWLSEMSANSRAFTPFLLAENKSNVFALIKDEKPKKSLIGKSNYSLFDDVLNDKQRNLNASASQPQLFMELFHAATQKLVKSKFRM